jgi:opacity protein-like surface antigen
MSVNHATAADHRPQRHTGTEQINCLCVCASLWFLIAMFAPAAAEAQIRGFADVGSTTFAATESFETILGSASGVVFGGGVEVMLPKDLFVNVRASRFRQSGERVFVFEGESFGLGIPTTVTVMPIEVTGGYRFDRGWPVIPYGGGGIGQHRYTETSDFATDAENVEESFTGYHLLGGAEFRLSRLIGAAGEVQWATVPDALGQDPNGVSNAFDETDLGGVTFRVKVVIGR